MLPFFPTISNFRCRIFSLPNFPVAVFFRCPFFCESFKHVQDVLNRLLLLSNCTHSFVYFLFYLQWSMLFIMIFVQSHLYFPSYSGVTCHHTLIQLLNQNLTENAIISTVTQHNQTHTRDSFIQNPNHKTCSKCLAVSSFITANRQLYMTAILYLHNDSTTHTDSQK